MSQTISLEEQRMLDSDYLTEDEKEYFRTYRKDPDHRQRIFQKMKEPKTAAFLSSLQQDYGFNKTRFF